MEKRICMFFKGKQYTLFEFKDPNDDVEFKIKPVTSIGSIETVNNIKRFTFSYDFLVFIHSKLNGCDFRNFENELKIITERGSIIIPDLIYTARGQK